MVAIMFVTDENVSDRLWSWTMSKSATYPTSVFLEESEVHVFRKYDKKKTKYLGVIDRESITRVCQGDRRGRGMKWTFSLKPHKKWVRRTTDQTSCANALGYSIISNRGNGVYRLQPLL